MMAEFKMERKFINQKLIVQVTWRSVRKQTDGICSKGVRDFYFFDRIICTRLAFLP